MSFNLAYSTFPLATVTFRLDPRGHTPARPLHARVQCRQGVELRLAVRAADGSTVRLKPGQWDAAAQQAVARSDRPAEHALVAGINTRLAVLAERAGRAEQELPALPGGLTAAGVRAALLDTPLLPVPVTRLTLPAALRLRREARLGVESPATSAAYERLAARVEAFAKRFGLPPEHLRLAATAQLPHAQLTGATLLRFRDWLFHHTDATNDTVNNALKQLRSALKFVALRCPEELGGEAGQQRALLLRELVERLPAELPDIFFPTPGEVLRLRAAPCADALQVGRDRWLLAAGTGLRRSDLNQAGRHQLKTTPTGEVDLHYLPHKTRARGATVVPLGPDELEIIRRYQNLFPDATWLVPPGSAHDDNATLHAWLRDADLPALHDTVVRRRPVQGGYRDEALPRWQAITFHAARHCYADALTGAGGELRLVQQLLGHRSYRSTLRYARNTAGQAAAAGRALLATPH